MTKSTRSGKTMTDGQFEWIRVDTLTVDPEYQRPLKAAQVKRIMDEFDPDAIGVLLVSRRGDGTDVLLDGQQRQAAFLRMGWGDQKVPCMVYEKLSPVREAALFLRYNAERMGMHPVHIFTASVAAADVEAVSINNLLVDRGIVVDTKTRSGSTAAVSVLQSIYHAGKSPLLSWVLDTALAVWPGDPMALGRMPLVGLAMFHMTYPKVRRDQLAKKLNRRTVDQLSIQEKQIRVAMGGSLAYSACHAMVQLYNYRRPEDEKLDSRLIGPGLSKGIAEPMSKAVRKRSAKSKAR